MKIVVDDKIPYIREKLQMLADQVVAIPGAKIAPADVKDADALIVRTRTRCDEKLLAGSKVTFVATATIGFDHIDVDYMERAGITWTSCPGCYAASVAQYLESALLLLQQQKGLQLDGATIGIVGCGHVGQKVKNVAERMGMRVLVCDPPVGSSDYVSLDVIEREADVITFHVPLTRGGSHPTFHLADEAFFGRLAQRPVIINTSRGGVVDNGALIAALDKGTVKDAVIDTWEGEPDISLALLNKVYIGTPHIAGYSADGKTNADNMVIDGLCCHFGIENRWHILPPSLPADFKAGDSEDDTKLALYNPLEDSRRLKSAPGKFEELRGNYPLRREKL